MSIAVLASLFFALCLFAAPARALANVYTTTVGQVR